jgi:hypothetical protein
MELLLEGLRSILELYAAKLPDWLLSLLLVVGSLRVLFKPLLALAYAVVSITPSEKDDELVKKIENSKVLKALVFVIDWFASIKLPKKK